MMNQPTVSVVMPALDAERWIGEALDCVLRQTVLPDEVIVIDDGSHDNTADRARSAGSLVRVIQQANKGVSAATNRGFAEATGHYVAICPADDCWETRKLEWQLEVLEAHPEIDVSFGHARYFGIEEREFPRPPWTGLLDLTRFAPVLYANDLIANPSALIRRTLHRRLGGYREERRVGEEDYDFWLRAAAAGAVFHYDPRLLVRLRQHGANLSSQALATWEAACDLHREHAWLAGDPDLVRRVVARDLARIGRCRLGLGKASEARHAYAASFRRRPTVGAGLAASLLALPGAGVLATRVRRAVRGTKESGSEES
jgi:glycosyltransferase involved in cell wall biosynthesis